MQYKRDHDHSNYSYNGFSMRGEINLGFSILVKPISLTYYKRYMVKAASKAVTTAVDVMSPSVSAARNMSFISGQIVTNPNAESTRVNPPMANGKQHYETVETICKKNEATNEASDCKEKNCSMPCGETCEKQTIGHLTSSSKVQYNEQQDKTPALLSENTNAKGQPKDQYMMVYDKPHDATLYEAQMDPQITDYLNGDSVNENIRKAKTMPAYDQD
jgi:hypothetical protein